MQSIICVGTAASGSMPCRVLNRQKIVKEKNLMRYRTLNGTVVGKQVGKRVPSLGINKWRPRNVAYRRCTRDADGQTETETVSEKDENDSALENGAEIRVDGPVVSDEQPARKRSKPAREKKGLFRTTFGNRSLPGNTTLRFFFSLIVMNLLLNLWPGSKSPVPGYVPPSRYITIKLSFSDYLNNLKKNDIAFMAIDGDHLKYKLKPGSSTYSSIGGDLDKANIWFDTVKPRDYRVPYESLLANGARFTAIERSFVDTAVNVMTYVVGFVVLLAVLNKVSVRMPQKGFIKGGSSSSMSDVTFEDVAGVDEAKEELQEIVEYLKEPDKFAKLGARPPKGVLLCGPPGTGKTMLAKAVAGEAGVPFFSTSASEFVELYVGMGALRVRELFATARKNAPAIVFIDEIDAVAKGRDSPIKGFRSSGNDEREQTLNQLLTELDGFTSEGLVICIAATNRADVLDPALLRPGRFDRRVPVERPDKIGREQILKVHIENNDLPLNKDFDISSLAAQTIGFTGADLANIVNEAALLAGRRGRDSVSAEDFDAAVLRTVAGIEKKRSILQGVEKSVVARHEVGHALVGTAVSMLVPSCNAVERLSIIPRTGGALGFTYSPPVSEDRALAFETELRGQLATLMGGRAAEAVTSTSLSTGASDDLRRATDLAHKCVTEFGFSNNIGPVNVDALGANEYSLAEGSQHTTSLVEQEVRDLCNEALQVAIAVVRENRELHRSLSNMLETNEKLQGENLQDSLSQVKIPQSLRSFVLVETSNDKD